MLLRLEDGVYDGLPAFRLWARSPEFPARGRIDYLAGTVDVDLSAEELQSHGALKVKLVARISQIIEEDDRGQVFTDRTRLSSQDASLSCEPDILFVSFESLQSGRCRYLAGSKSDRLVEVEGSVDLVVEIVSDSSAGKDTRRLPPLYARAGVQELWLVDARGAEVDFRIFELEEGGYGPVAPDEHGFLHSRALDRRFKIEREPWRVPGTWRYSILSS